MARRVIRRARAEDRAAIEAIVREAYSIYIARIGKPPGPMLDDYAALIADNMVSVLEEADGRIAAIIVLLPKPDHLPPDNIAIRPDRQGQGLGRQLTAFTEGEASRLGSPELQLHTDGTMVGNSRLFGQPCFV